MIAPTPRLISALLAGGFLAVVPTFTDERLWALWLVYVIAVAAAAAADFAAAPRLRNITVTVECPHLTYIGDADSLAIALALSEGQSTTTVHGLIELGEELAPVEPFVVRLAGGGVARVERPLQPLRRGVPEIERLWLRWSGPLRLIAHTVELPQTQVIRIVPNVRAVRAAAMRFFQNREFLAGLRVERFQGEGSAFDALREYVPGLDYRSIDWKASARHTRLLVRDFRAERNQNVVVAFDTGHLMGEPLAGMPKVDHAINAALLLAYVSLRTGDRVGLFAFDDASRMYMEPASGVGSIRHLQARVAEIAYSTAESNFTLALTDLTKRLRRRSLIVLFTDFVDSVTAELLLDNTARLARRHVILFVALRDPALDEIAAAAPGTLLDLDRAVVAGDLIRERDVVLRRLERMGVLVLDTPPERLSGGLISRYLDIKRRELVA